MADVVDDLHAELLRGVSEDRLKCRTDLVRNNLPIGKRAVGGAVHGREILPPLRRSERGAGQLLILDRDAVMAHGLLEDPQIVARHLVAEPSGPAVNHHHNLVLSRNPHGRGCLAVKDAVIRDDLHFEVVVPRAQGAELVDATLDRVGAHL